MAAGLPIGVGTDELGGWAAESTGEDELGEAAGELSGELLLGLDPTGVDLAAGVVSACVSVTGRTVVEMAKVEVTRRVESAGQSVIVAAQLVTVITLVAYTVDVVMR